MIRRHRYYYKNEFTVSDINLKMLKVLQLKYSRDYLKFFKSLRSSFGKADTGVEEIDAALKSTNKLVGILDSCIIANAITKEDAKVIYQLVQDIENNKNQLVELAKNNQDVGDMLNLATEDSEVSVEDLSVTQKKAKSIVNPAVASLKEGKLDYLERTMPKTYTKGKEIVKGLAASVLGPMYPMAEIGKDLLFEGYGLARSAKDRLFYGKRSVNELNSKSDRRGTESDRRGVTIPNQYSDYYSPSYYNSQQGSKEKAKKFGAEVFKDFFDKDAYRAKWTKELLKYIKDATKKNLWNPVTSLVKEVGEAIKDAAIGIGGAVVGGTLGGIGAAAGIRAATRAATGTGVTAGGLLGGISIPLLYGAGAMLYSHIFETFFKGSNKPIPVGAASKSGSFGIIDPSSPPYTPGKPLIGGKSDSDRIDSIIDRYKAGELPPLIQYPDIAVSKIIPEANKGMEGSFDLSKVIKDSQIEENKRQMELQSQTTQEIINMKISIETFTDTLKRQMDKLNNNLSGGPRREKSVNEFDSSDTMRIHGNGSIEVNR